MIPRVDDPLPTCYNPPINQKETTMAHENRSTYIHMRISKSVKELIREQAKKEGMSISEYVEDACMRCIEADKEEGKS